jgi:uncharacterized protein
VRIVWKIIRPVLIWLLVQILLTYVALNALVAFYFGPPRRESITVTPQTYSWQSPLAYTDVRFPARGDGLQIAGWYIPAENARRAVVLVHGKDGSRTGEFVGRFIELAAGLHSRGYAVLMIDLRGHGQSADATTGFGTTERNDVLGAVDHLATLGFTPDRIGLLGVSLGGAATLGAMRDDERIGAVVTDSTFASLLDALALQWTGLTRTPAALSMPGVWVAQSRSGVDYADARPVDDLQAIGTRPVLLIHGEADPLVPLAQADVLAAGNPRAQTWRVPGATHGGVYRVNPRAYLDRVDAFFDDSLTR